MQCGCHACSNAAAAHAATANSCPEAGHEPSMHLRGLRHAARAADEAAARAWRRAALLAGQHQGAALRVLLALPRKDQAVVPASRAAASSSVQPDQRVSQFLCIYDSVNQRMWGQASAAHPAQATGSPHLPPYPPPLPPKRACTPAARRRWPAVRLVNGRATGACVAAQQVLILPRGGRAAVPHRLPARAVDSQPYKCLVECVCSTAAASRALQAAAQDSHAWARALCRRTHASGCLCTSLIADCCGWTRGFSVDRATCKTEAARGATLQP